MGLDWRFLSLSAYMEAVEAHNEANDPDAHKAPQRVETGRLERFMKFHTLQ